MFIVYMHEYTLKFMIDNIQYMILSDSVHCFTRVVVQISNSLPELASFFLSIFKGTG